jgi:hypothetical protein
MDSTKADFQELTQEELMGVGGGCYAANLYGPLSYGAFSPYSTMYSGFNAPFFGGGFMPGAINPFAGGGSFGNMMGNFMGGMFSSIGNMFNGMNNMFNTMGTLSALNGGRSMVVIYPNNGFGFQAPFGLY